MIIKKVNVELNLNEALDIVIVLKNAYKDRLKDARTLLNFNEIKLSHSSIRECKSFLKMIKAINI